MSTIFTEHSSLKELNFKNLRLLEILFKSGCIEQIDTLDSSIQPTDNEILQLTDYLFKVKNGSYYKIILLKNYSITTKYTLFFLLIKEMAERLYLFNSYEESGLNSFIYLKKDSKKAQKITSCAILF